MYRRLLLLLPWALASALGAVLWGWWAGLAIAVVAVAAVQGLGEGGGAGGPPAAEETPAGAALPQQVPLAGRILERIDLALLVVDRDLLVRASNAEAVRRFGNLPGWGDPGVGLAELIRAPQVLELVRRVAGGGEGGADGGGEEAVGELRCRAWPLPDPAQSDAGDVLLAFYPAVPGSAEDLRAVEGLEVLRHEVRNPLAALAARLELARKGAEGEARENLEAAVLAQQRLSDLLGEGESGWGDHSGMAPQQARAAVDSAARRARSHGLELQVEHEGGPEAALPALAGSQTELVLALDNLLDNARRYGDGRARLRIGPNEDGRVAFAVRDGGPGVAAQEAGQIFQRGYRTKLALRLHPEAGRGVGLFLARRAARRCGGDLLLREQPSNNSGEGGKAYGGAEFLLLWPVREEGGQVKA